MPGHEILEHTADVGVRAWGESLGELLAQAALGLQELAMDCSRVDQRESYALEASGEDVESLLVNWLNEIIYWLDGKRVAFGRLEARRVSENRVEAEGWGEPRDGERHEPRLVIKAATYHQLRVTREGDAWSAEVYLDI